MAWVGSEGKALVTDGVMSLAMWPDTTHPATMGAHDLAAAPPGTVKDGTTWVQLRFLAESLGFSVRWDDATRSVILQRITANFQIQISTQKDRSETTDLKVAIQYPQFAGLSPSAQTAINAHFADWAAKARAAGVEAAPDAQSNPDHLYQVEVAANCQVTYNQNALVSVLLDDYMYTDGAHGGTVRSSYAFNATKGKVYSLGDLEPGLAAIPWD